MLGGNKFELLQEFLEFKNGPGAVGTEEPEEPTVRVFQVRFGPRLCVLQGRFQTVSFRLHSSVHACQSCVQILFLADATLIARLWTDPPPFHSSVHLFVLLYTFVRLYRSCSSTTRRSSRGCAPRASATRTPAAWSP